jgi:hypothetical protein
MEPLFPCPPAFGKRQQDHDCAKTGGFAGITVIYLAFPEVRAAFFGFARLTHARA